MKNILNEENTRLLLKATNLLKKSGKRNILSIKSLEIFKNDRIAVIGPSGSSKTTLCEILSLTKKVNAGKIEYLNDLRVSFQSHDKEYTKGISGYDFLKLYINIYNIDINSEELYLKINSLDLWPVIKKPLSKLSFLQKQKVNVLLAIIINPDLIILDELTSNLDLISKKVIFDIIFQFLNSKPESGLLFISHDMAEIEKYSNKIWLLYNGRIIDTYNTKDIVASSGSVERFISVNFKEYKEQNLEIKSFSIKDEIDKSWERKWDIGNERRKAKRV